MIICPNFSNPEVAREFEELKNATSEAAAYHIWSLNNGNAIDKAPNGAPSKLFLTLLEHYNGDRTKAIQAKAKCYGNSFLNWFGDWTGNATYEVYQGRTSELPDGRRYNYWTLYERDAKTYGPNVRKVRINPSGFLFKRELRWRTNLNGERVFDWDWSEEYERVIEEFKAQTGYDYFDILENGEEGIKKQNKFFEFLESKGYNGYAEFNELEQRGGEEHANPYTVTFGDNGIIDSDVSKVVDENGEPLIVWHTGEKNINIFNTDKVVYDKYGNPLVIPNAIYTTDSFETSISYEEEEQDLIGEYVEGKGIVYADPIFKSQTYPLFVNIKNPRIIDAKGKLWNKIEIDGKITTTRKIEEETWQSDYDGVIIKNVIDYGGNPIMPSYMTEQFEPSDVLISFNPNQIKSATDNQGTTPWEGSYSRENSNIYDNTVSVSTTRQQLTEELQQLNQKHQTLLNNFGLDDKNNPIFVLDKIGEKHGIDIQVKGNVVKSEILFPTDWFVYLLKSNISLDEGTVKSLNEDLDRINYELLSLNAELENGSWYSEEIGEWFKFDESSKLFKRDRILQLLKDKKHIESLLEKHNTQQNVVQNKISEYRQLLYNLLFYLHSIGLNTVKSTDFFNSLSPLDLYIENYDLPIISEIVNNIQYLVGKETLNKCFSISDDYILVDVEGLLEHVKQNYEVSVKNSIISDIKDVISGKYRRTAEDRLIFEQEVEKILTLKQELQNLLDDLQKTERELNLKDYLKSLRNTLDC